MKRTITFIVMLCIIGMAQMGNAQEVKINHDATIPSTSGNGLAVEADGTLRMDGVAMVWDDLRVTLDNGSNAAVLDYFSGSTGPQIWYFRNNANVEAMSFTVQLPHNYKEGTKIYPHLHWTPKGSASGDVIWNFEYTWANYNATTPELFPVITTSTVTSTGPFIANTHRITALTANNVGLTGTGKNISSILICRIWRNSSNTSDTYANHAGLLFLDFHYQLDTFGSREEYSK